jgi:hypothetical protein
MQAGKRTSTWVLLLLLCAGCGGSGSSGFDVTSEDAAIARALEGNRCVASGDLTICANGASPTVPSPTGQPRIEIGIAPDGVVDCVRASDEATCSAAVPIATHQVAPGAEIRVATRGPGAASDWLVGSALEPLPQLSAAVTIDLGAGAAGTPLAPLQIAVLVFAGPTPDVPARVPALASTAADFAFVSAPLTARPSSAGTADPAAAGAVGDSGGP